MTPSPNSPSLSDQITQGRTLGYSDDDMVNYLAARPELGTKIQQAKQAQYNSKEILDYLGGSGSQAQSTQTPPQSAPDNTVHSRSFITGQPLNVDMSRMNKGMDVDSPSRQQVVQGAKGVFAPGATVDQRAESAHQAFQGATDLGKGAALAVAPFAPVQTVVGAGAGLAGQWAGTHAAQAMGAGPGVSHLVGDASGLVAGGAAAHLTGGMPGPLEPGAPSVDPYVAALRVWGLEKDPKILDDISNGNVKLTSGMSDLKAPFQDAHASAPQSGYANESVLRAMPVAQQQNRAAWNAWMTRAQGQTASGRGIVQATANALKETATDERAHAILDDAIRNYGRNLTAPELESLLQQKNGELAGFYSRDGAVQDAARQAGADTLKTQALLEAQARAIRESLYNLLDPTGSGTRPQEIQARYGALKSIERGAQDERSKIIAEHPLNIYERGADVKFDPRAALKQKLGNREWLIENAINSVPDAGPLPLPDEPFYPRNYTPNARQIPMRPTPPKPRPTTAPEWEMDVRPQLPQASVQAPQPSPTAIQKYQPTGESVAVRLGKQIWSALGGPPVQ